MPLLLVGLSFQLLNFVSRIGEAGSLFVLGLDVELKNCGVFAHSLIPSRSLQAIASGAFVVRPEWIILSYDQNMWQGQHFIRV